MTRRSAALQLVLALSLCHVALAQTTGTFTPIDHTPLFTHVHTAFGWPSLDRRGMRVEASHSSLFMRHEQELMTRVELHDSGAGHSLPRRSHPALVAEQPSFITVQIPL